MRATIEPVRRGLTKRNEETVRHPLGNPELETQRQEIKNLIAEYEENWQHSANPNPE
jgi:hypothetical protein